MPFKNKRSGYASSSITNRRSKSIKEIWIIITKLFNSQTFLSVKSQQTLQKYNNLTKESVKKQINNRKKIFPIKILSHIFKKPKYFTNSNVKRIGKY